MARKLRGWSFKRKIDLRSPIVSSVKVKRQISLPRTFLLRKWIILRHDKDILLQIFNDQESMQRSAFVLFSVFLFVRQVYAMWPYGISGQSVLPDEVVDGNLLFRCSMLHCVRLKIIRIFRRTTFSLVSFKVFHSGNGTFLLGSFLYAHARFDAALHFTLKLEFFQFIYHFISGKLHHSRRTENRCRKICLILTHSIYDDSCFFLIFLSFEKLRFSHYYRRCRCFFRCTWLLLRFFNSRINDRNQLSSSTMKFPINEIFSIFFSVELSLKRLHWRLASSYNSNY